MPLRSALEDFESCTLQAVPGLFGKLRYIAELRAPDGAYSHWGMGKVHGQEASRRAIRTAHNIVLGEILRTPLRNLVDDVSRSASGLNASPQEFLVSLGKMTPRILPERALVVSEKHLRAVLRALMALLKSQAPANRPDALPPRPPVQ